MAGFAVDAQFVTGDNYLGLPLVRGDALESHFAPADFDLFVAIGYSSLNATRAQHCEAARARGYHLATYVSSRASTWPDLQIGDNCLIMEATAIQPFVKIGSGVIMFSGASISHEVEIGDYCFIASEATICGGVSLGPRTFIGANAIVREHLQVGRDCIVGAGAIVTKDVGDGHAFIAPATKDSGIPSRRLHPLL